MNASAVQRHAAACMLPWLFATWVTWPSLLPRAPCLPTCQVFKHHHEEATGRTSSIGQHTLCLDSKGGILNDSLFRTATCHEYIAKASKVCRTAHT